MEYALKFANTGHLALSTLHANNCISTMERVMGFFPREAREAQAKRVSQNLRAIVCQRLAPAVGGGKIAIVEVLINTGYISDMIAKQELDGLKDAIERGGNYSMQSFDQHLVQLYHEGKIAEEVAYEYADSVSNVKVKIRTANAGRKVSALNNAGLSLSPIKEEEEDEEPGSMLGR